jgi:multiple sugar transport system substrate-binding protein
MARLRGAAAGVLALAAWGIVGCGGGGGSGATAPKAAEPAFKGVTIEVAAVAEPKLLDLVGAQRGEWQGSRGGDVRLREGAVAAPEARSADVVLFPADRLGDLVDAGALAVLPEALVRPPARPPGESSESSGPPPDPFAFDDLVAACRDEVTKYGDERMALPLGGSTLVLAFRRDALSREANRDAAKAAGINLEPPRTWERLDALAKFFHGRDWDGDGQADSGIALPWGSDKEGVGDAAFLARAAALALRPDVFSFAFDAETMEPRIASPPFVAALEGLVALKAFGPEGAEGFDAEAARAAFRAGKVALLIDRAERASSWVGKEKALSVGVAPLPGSTRIYDPDRKDWETPSAPNRPSYLPVGGGWLAGVSAKSEGRRKEAAIDFVKYLAGPETSTRILADRAWPMVPVRSTQLGQGMPDPRSAPGVDSRSWSLAASQTLQAARVVPGLRIPSADDYLADLSRARAEAAKGTPPESALKAAAKAWSGRVESLGRDRQRWHYRRSLNKLPTPPEPPARRGSV